MKKIVSLIVLLFVVVTQGICQFKNVDELLLGNKASERTHGLLGSNSIIITGGLGESARQLLPLEGNNIEGGNIAFAMKVDPLKQNYVTVRFWGSDIGKGNNLLLFCEGKQMGYRHLGDYDILDISNDEQPLKNRFYYVTAPLPFQMTKGKKVVNLAIHSTGPIWGYGNTKEKYQKNMVLPSKGIYKVYTHLESCFVPSNKENQGKLPQNVAVRKTPGIEILTQLKERVNGEIERNLHRDRALTQSEMWFLAKAYHVNWSNAYHNSLVPSVIMPSIDAYYQKYLENPKYIYDNPSESNSSWTITGPMAICIRYLYDEFKDKLDQPLTATATRREAWSAFLQESVQYAKTHRRQYTNQSMIIDMFLYECNRALMLIDPLNALPEYQPLRYLYESVGLVPWLGIDTPSGPEKPLGDNYTQLTAKGLTKELGFVGYYGEVLDWVVSIYKSTGIPAIADSGDKKIREQLLKIMRARLNFRYPAVDSDGCKAMRAEAVVGWRDGGHYPGDVIYGDRGQGWDATPFQTAAATLDPLAVGVAQQALEDNQFFEMVRRKMEENSLRVNHVLMEIPEQYEIIKKQAPQSQRLPMSKEMPDYVFSDEEDGVVAIKNGDEILYASLYWRARYAINNLARIHYIIPTMDRIATVYQHTDFTDSGLKYTRPDWVNMGFSGSHEFYPGIHSAHAGEELSIAKVPDGIKYTPGNENVYAGKGDFYTLRFGKYLIGMNCTEDREFELEVPTEKGEIINLTDTNYIIKGKKIKVAPKTTTVLYVR